MPISGSTGCRSPGALGTNEPTATQWPCQAWLWASATEVQWWTSCWQAPQKRTRSDVRKLHARAVLDGGAVHLRHPVRVELELRQRARAYLGPQEGRAGVSLLLEPVGVDEAHRVVGGGGRELLEERPVVGNSDLLTGVSLSTPLPGTPQRPRRLRRGECSQSMKPP
jgi:hypothetical protein